MLKKSNIQCSFQNEDVPQKLKKTLAIPGSYTSTEGLKRLARRNQATIETLYKTYHAWKKCLVHIAEVQEALKNKMKSDDQSRTPYEKGNNARSVIVGT